MFFLENGFGIKKTYKGWYAIKQRNQTKPSEIGGGKKEWGRYTIFYFKFQQLLVILYLLKDLLW